MIAAPGMVEWMLALMVTMGVGLPLGYPPGAEDPFLVQAAPDDALYYAMWVESQEPQASSTNRVEQLLAEPEVRQFVGNLFVELEAYARRSASENNSQQASALVDLGVSLVQKAFHGPAMMFVNKVDLSGDIPRIDAGAVLGVGEDGQRIVEQINHAVETVMEVSPTSEQLEGATFYSVSFEDPVPTVRWGIVGTHLVVGVGEGSIEGILARSKTAAPAWYLAARRDAQVPRLASIGYVNLARVHQLLEQLDVPPQVAQILEFLGADNLGQLANVSGMDDDGVVSVTWLQATEGLQGMLDLATKGSLTPEDLAVIPADATVAVAADLNLALVFDQLRGFLGQLDPSALQNLDSGLELLKQEFDIDLRTDLLASIGTKWCIYTTPSHGNWLTGWAATVAVKDAGGLREINDKAIQVFKQIQQGERRPTELREMEVDGQRVNYLVIPGFPLSPAWCVTDKHLVLGLFPQTVKSHLMRDGDEETFADNPQIAARLKEGKVVLVQYMDTAKIAELAYPAMQIGVRALGQQLLEEGIDLKVHQLPTQGSIVPHLRPQFSLLIRTDDALVLRSTKSIPAGGGFVTTAPISMALVLPAVQAARTAARRLETMNNMKQLGIAMLNWHDTYGALPAMFNVEKEGKRLLSWRVHLLPFLGHIPLYGQFRLNEPWDSEHNKKLIPLMPAFYRSPLSAPGAGKTNYRAVTLPDAAGAMRPPARAGKPSNLPVSQKDGLFGHRFADITDGLEQTILLVEVGDDKAVIWTKPEDLLFSATDGTKGWGAKSQSTFTTLFCNGRVRQLSRGIDLKHLKALLTRAGGEVIPAEANLAP